MKTKTLGIALAFGVGIAALGLSGAADAEAPVHAVVRSLDQIKESGELRVAVYRDFPPFSSSQNGVLSGIDVDIAQELARLIGVKVSFKEQAPGESVNDDLRNAIWRGHYLDHNTADVMMHIPTDPALVELNDKVAIFAPYYHEQLAVAGDPDAFDADDGLDAFRKAKVGVEIATMADMAVMMADHGALINNVRHFKTLSQAVDGMDKGEVAAVMGVRAELEGALGARKSKYPITPISLPQFAHSEWTLGMAVDADNKALAKTLDEGMATLLANGAIKKIFSDHGLDFVAP